MQNSSMKTRQLSPLSLIFTSLIFSSACSLSNAESIAIIVNPATADTAINIETVRKIYLGKTNQTDSGTTVTAVDQDESDPELNFIKKSREKPLTN